MAINKELSTGLLFLFGPLGWLGVLGGLLWVGWLTVKANTSRKLFRAAAFSLVLVGLFAFGMTGNDAAFKLLVIMGVMLLAISFVIPQERETQFISK